jgi:hypothetical protein
VGRPVGRTHDPRSLRLVSAAPQRHAQAREAVETGRFGLHWEALDEDISIAGLLAGRGDETVKPAASSQAELLSTPQLFFALLKKARSVNCRFFYWFVMVPQNIPIKI